MVAEFRVSCPKTSRLTLSIQRSQPSRAGMGLHSQLSGESLFTQLCGGRTCGPTRHEPLDRRELPLDATDPELRFVPWEARRCSYDRTPQPRIAGSEFILPLLQPLIHICCSSCRYDFSTS